MWIRKILAIILFGFLSLAYTAADQWMQDFQLAKKTATQAKKDLFVLFTGLDWCPPCQLMHKEVFSQQLFLQKISQDFILVLFNYPQKTPQEERIRQQNEKLARDYQIDSFPTIMLMDKDGRPYKIMKGYSQEGVKAFLKTIEDAQKQKKQLAELERKIEESPTKAQEEKQLDEFYHKLQELELASYYGDFFDRLLRDNPSLNFKNHYLLTKEYRHFLATWITKESDFSQVLTIAQELADNASPWPRLQQKILLTQGMIYVNALNNRAKAQEAFLKVKELNANSPEGNTALQFLSSL